MTVLEVKRHDRNRMRNLVLVGMAALAVVAIGDAVPVLVAAVQDPPIPSVMVAGPGDETTAPEPGALPFDEDPEWTVQMDDLDGVIEMDADARLIGDTVVLSSSPLSTSENLVALDAGTGEERWRIDEPDRDEDPQIRYEPTQLAVADEPDADQVYIGYETDVSLPDGSPGVEQGVAAVSLADGDIAWTEALDTGPEYDKLLTLRAAGGGRVAAEVWDSDDGDEYRYSRTDVLDAETGESLWQVDDVEVDGFTADLMLTRDRGDDGDPTAITAWDAANGDQLWTYDGAVDSIDGDFGERLVLRGHGWLSVVDAATGTGDPVAANTAGGCPVAAPGLAACNSLVDRGGFGGYPVMVDPEADRPVTSCFGLPDRMVTGFIGDQAAVYHLADEFTVLVDSDCNVVSTKVDGRIVAAGGRWAVLRQSQDFSDSATLSVHRMTG